MIYEAILQPRARIELLNGWIWYEERQVGLGDRFENEVYKRIDKYNNILKDTPSEKNFSVRQKIKIFPYLIIYRVAEKEKVILISSIFHTSRNPEAKYTSIE